MTKQTFPLYTIISGREGINITDVEGFHNKI